jgi:hypothetical protein
VPREFYLPTREGWEAAQRSIQDTERERGKRGFFGQDQPGTMPGIVIEIIGERIRVITTSGTETTTPTTSTSSTSSTTGTTCPGSATTQTTTTTEYETFVYPARFVYLQVSHGSKESFYVPGENCWAQEVNNLPLGIGCKLPGQLCGQFRGYAVVCVKGDGTNNSCTATTTTTTCVCSGVCVWELQLGSTSSTTTGTGTTGAPYYRWVLVEDGCQNTTTTATTTTTSQFDPDTGGAEDGGEEWGERPSPPPNIIDLTQPPADPKCYCLSPDFCPPDHITATCSITYTFCARTEEPIPPPSLCFFGSTSSTSSTTVTTIGGGGGPCGGPCVFRCVPGIGWMRISGDCLSGVPVGDGTDRACAGCQVPSGQCNNCTNLTLPCATVTANPCGGVCEWVWPDQPGLGWILDPPGNPCLGGNNTLCRCATPSSPGSSCGQRTTTNCRESGGGGGSTSATSATTTTTIHCQGWCQLRGNGSGGWTIVSDCGEDCDGCQEPIYASEDECDTLLVPCGADTTSSTTTTTTTTVDCPSDICEWQCVQTAGGRDIPNQYTWITTAYCTNQTCACPAPVIPCNQTNVGLTTEMYCEQVTSSTSTTTTTTPPNPCNQGISGCAFRCERDSRGFFSWVKCADRCDPAQNCSCCPPDNNDFPCSPACPPCTAFREGQVCGRDCRCEVPSSTTSVSTETHPGGTGPFGINYDNSDDSGLYPAGIC